MPAGTWGADAGGNGGDSGVRGVGRVAGRRAPGSCVFLICLTFVFGSVIFCSKFAFLDCRGRPKSCVVKLQ